MIMVTVQMPVLGLENHHSLRQHHCMSCLCDVGLEVCFNIHMPEAFEGNSRRLQRCFLRTGGAHSVFPIHQAPGWRPEDETWNLWQGRRSLFFLSFPVLSHSWHLRVACQCPDSFISFPFLCGPTLAWDVDFPIAMLDVELKLHWVSNSWENICLSAHNG